MLPGTFLFQSKWKEKVKKLLESGMGYTVATVILNDGQRFEQTLITSGHLTNIRGMTAIPFTESDIAEIKPTHDKWKW